MRQFTERHLIIASHNPGKVREIHELLAPFNVRVGSAGEFDLEEPEETAPDFIGNAEIKSRFVSEATGLPALADDSGLVVPTLDGDPGIYSARWAGPTKDFNMAMDRVRTELIEKTGSDTGHPAYFACALSLTWPDGHTESVEGRVDGTLTFPARGDRGFGYDPIFIADGYELTFAEIDPNEKHAISHRADAFKKLVAACFE